MSGHKRTDERKRRAPLAVWVATVGPRGIWAPALLIVALLVAALALAPRAEAFVYWADENGGRIGRANLDGTGVDKRFITGAGNPFGVAVDAEHIYWSNRNFSAPDTIGRANLDGTGVDPNFIAGARDPTGVAVDRAHVYWGNFDTGTIGRANLDGTGVDQDFITPGAGPTVGVAVDAAHIYWANSEATIGRANLDGTGVDRSFINAVIPGGVAVDAAHVYWTSVAVIGRANLDGTGVDQDFITRPGGDLVGMAVDAAHIYWATTGWDSPVVPPGIGRADLDGTGVAPSFITGFRPGGVAVDALRSFSFGKVKRNKKRGTARLAVKLPGPGEVELVESEGVKPNRKQAEAASKVKLSIKPRGEAKQKLKRRGKAKVKAEVAYSPQRGDPTIVANTDTKTVKLIKR